MEKLKASIVVASHLSDCQESVMSTEQRNMRLNFAKFLIFKTEGDLRKEIDPDVEWEVFIKKFHTATRQKCVCIEEPMSDSGLEGYNRKDEYEFEFREKDKNGKPYYRVYHDAEHYETCGVNTFKKYFKPL